MQERLNLQLKMFKLSIAAVVVQFKQRHYGRSSPMEHTITHNGPYVQHATCSGLGARQAALVVRVRDNALAAVPDHERSDPTVRVRGTHVQRIGSAVGCYRISKVW